MNLSTEDRCVYAIRPPVDKNWKNKNTRYVKIAMADGAISFCIQTRSVIFIK